MRYILLAIVMLAAAPALAEMRVPADRAEIVSGFVPVVKKATPAVVNIYARRVVNVRSPFRNDPFFQDLFRNFGAPQKRVENSLGSGVILGAEGIVVSNYHVVGGATDIRVVLNDRREFSAKVLLSDKQADLAVLKLKGAHELPALSLRDSDTVEVGELVLAIGNPFGVGQTVSSGIVSGLARSGLAIGSSRGYYIQTDAPINPGNSGGALVDVRGRLIGINTAILSRSGGSNGIGFAIPSALVARFVEQARAGKTRFERPWPGLDGQPVTDDMAEGLGLKRPRGVVITRLHPKSPFRAAGFEVGDVITQVDAHPVNTPAEMRFRMTVTGLGTSAVVTRVHRGKQDLRRVAMIAAPDTPPRAQLTTGDRSAIPGLTLSTVNPRVIAQYDLPLSAEGVVVDDPGAIGLRAGLRKGDVLRAINEVPVKDTRAARSLLRDARRRLDLVVERGGRRLSMHYRL